MSSGRTHARIATGAALAIGAASVPVMQANMPAGLGLLAGAIGGLLITPDIDLPTKTVEEIRIYRASETLGVLWQSLWTPYALMFEHRGVSHWPVIGTATRIAYLAVMAYVILIYFVAGLIRDICAIAGCVLAKDFQNVTVVALVQLIASSEAAITFIVFMFSAWAFQDVLHTLMDWQYSYKRRNGSFRLIVVGLLLTILMWGILK